MTTKELKTEIQKVLDTVPEGALEEVLDYLKVFSRQSEDRVGAILTEDKDLLARLAK